MISKSETLPGILFGFQTALTRHIMVSFLFVFVCISMFVYVCMSMFVYACLF